MSWLESLGSNRGSVGSAPWEVGSLWRPGQPTKNKGLKQGWTTLFFHMFDMFWYVWKNLGGTGTSMAIHQWFKAWSTLAILHQNQRIKCQILTNHSPVDLHRPCGKHLKQTRENPSFFTQRNLGLFGKKKKVSSLSEALRGEWQTMMGAFPSVCGRGTQIVSTSTCLRFSFKNHRNKLRTPELIEDGKQSDNPLKSL